MWKSFAKATSVGREAKIQAHSVADRLSPSRTDVTSLLWAQWGEPHECHAPGQQALGNHRKPSLNAGAGVVASLPHCGPHQPPPAS